MCQVCEMKKAQEGPIREIGRLMMKREKSILMGDRSEADEIKPILLSLFEKMVSDQDKFPSLLDGGNIEPLICLLTKKHDAHARL